MINLIIKTIINIFMILFGLVIGAASEALLFFEAFMLGELNKRPVDIGLIVSCIILSIILLFTGFQNIDILAEEN